MAELNDAQFNERKRGIEEDQVRMHKWNDPLVPDRIAILRDLVKTVNHILVYLDEITQTLSDADGHLDCLNEDFSWLRSTTKRT